MWNRLFVFGSLVLLALTCLWLWRDTEPEWKKYQREYKTIALDLARTEIEREKIQGEPLAIKQIVTSQFGRISPVDRCMTCHLGADNPDFDSVKVPFTYCPQLENHTAERFGCSVCHLGEGFATTLEAAHGYDAYWYEPLLQGEYMQASCGKCHFEPYVEGAPMLAIGRRLYDYYGCVNCHKIYKKGGNAGPDLTQIGAKQANWYDWGEHHPVKMTNIEWLFKHFKNSQYYDPDSKMTNYDMTDANARALSIYMLSLLDESYPDKYYLGEKPFLQE